MKKFDQSREISLFIEKLRAYRNLTLEEFLHDIVSIRQYRRYLSGDSTLSYLILDQLATRLGFSAEYVIMELETEKIKQSKSVSDLYNSIVTNDLERAKNLFLEIDERHLISENSVLLFKHSKNMFDYVSGINSQLVTINRTKKLINLDQLLKRKALSSSELLILVSFFYFDKYKEINIIAERLASYVDNHISIVTGHNIKVVTLVLEELSRYYSIISNYEKMLYYATEGIRYSQSIKSYYLLSRLYYLAGAASHELNLLDQRDKHLTGCLHILNVEGNDQMIAHFKRLFKERFDVDVAQLLTL